jgi:hypothetical protein
VRGKGNICKGNQQYIAGIAEQGRQFLWHWAGGFSFLKLIDHLQNSAATHGFLGDSFPVPDSCVNFAVQSISTVWICQHCTKRRSILIF